MSHRFPRRNYVPIALRLDRPHLLVSEMIELTVQLIHPSTPKSSASLILLPLPISSIPDSEFLNALTQISSTKKEIKLTRGSWSEDDDEPFSQVGMGGLKGSGRADVRREVDGMYM